MNSVAEIWEHYAGEFPVLVNTIWGGYIIHTEREDKSVCVKTLIINPSFQISLQYHNLRSEFWYIADKNALYEFTLDNESEIYEGGDRHHYIPKYSLHCIRNLNQKPLIIHETQMGICSEKDIVRVYDPYADKR